MSALSICFLALVAYAASYDFEDPFYNQVLATELEEIEVTLENFNTQQGLRKRRQIDDDDDGDDFDNKHKHKKHHKHHDNNHHHHHHHRRHHDNDDDHHRRHYNNGHHQKLSQDKCLKKRFNQCCDIDIMKNHRYQNRENKQECFVQVYGESKERLSVTPNIFKCEDPEKRKRDMTCFVQCMAHKSNLVDEDGNIIETQFAAFVKDHAKKHWVAPYLDNIISKCLNEAENATAYMGKSEAVTDGCNPAAIKAGHCFLRELQMNCPSEEISNPDRCEKFRSMVNKKFEESVSHNSIE